MDDITQERVNKFDYIHLDIPIKKKDQKGKEQTGRNI